MALQLLPEARRSSSSSSSPAPRLSSFLLWHLFFLLRTRRARRLLPRDRTNMATISSLPTELLHQILETAYESYDSVSWRQRQACARAFSLVVKSW